MKSTKKIIKKYFVIFHNIILHKLYVIFQTFTFAFKDEKYFKKTFNRSFVSKFLYMQRYLLISAVSISAVVHLVQL